MTRQGIATAKTLRFAAAIWLVAGTLAGTTQRVRAQTASSTPASASAASSNASLDTLVAPIALYPDALVADILPASTFPVEIVEAARALTNGAKPTAAQMSQWDASIQALVEFPTVVNMMNNDLGWTTQLGQAVAQSQSNVMAAIQRVRAEAQKAGNLQSNDKQTVTTQASTIVIEPANPQVIYVPQYNPVMIIQPAPAYIAAPAGYGMMTFGLGFAAGALTAYACDWGHGYGGGSININNNYNYTNVNNNNYNHTNVNNTNVNNTKANTAKVNNASYSSWKAPTNVGHITNSSAPPTGNGAYNAKPSTATSPHTASGEHYGSNADHASDSYGGDHAADNWGGDSNKAASGGMFGGADGDGWASRTASDRGAQSLGSDEMRGAYGNFRSGGGSFRSGGHPRF